MKKISFFIILLIQSLYAASHPPQIITAKGQAVYFGQPISEVQKIFGIAPVDVEHIARPGIDKVIKTNNIRLTFDSGLLWMIFISAPLDHITKINLFPKEWRQFNLNDVKKTKDGITRENFDKYLEQWIEAAVRLGARQTASPRAMTERNTFNIRRKSDYSNNNISIYFGPIRLAKNGIATWCDGISFYFNSKEEQSLGYGTAGVIQAIGVFSDQFNTRGR